LLQYRKKLRSSPQRN